MAYETFNNNIPPGNYWAAVKSFFNRGGFVNGLNPSIVGKIWYVNGEGAVYTGYDGNSGRAPTNGFATIAKALDVVDDGDIVVLSGVFREQVVAPVKYDVTVLGAANQPRQATNNGVATGGGASWLAPTSPTATTPLVRVVAQGWNFFNIQFAPVAASACITFDRRETTAIPDSSHGSVLGCYFSTGGSGGMGVEIIEAKKIYIKNNVFEALTGAGGYAVKTTAGDGVANPSYCEIMGNKFAGNTNDCGLTGMEKGLIVNNTFYTSDVILAGNRLVLTASSGSGHNHVLDNNFADVAADVTIAKGYKPGTADVWRNWVTDTNVPIVTVPA